MKQLILLLPAFLLFACSTPNEPELDREVLCSCAETIKTIRIAYPDSNWLERDKECAEIDRIHNEKYGNGGTASDEEKNRYKMYQCE